MAPIVHEVATGLRFPEGPIAMPDGPIVLVEIERQCISRVTPDGAVTTIARTGGGPNGAAIGPDGKCYVCNNGGLAWLESARHGLRPGWPGSFTAAVASNASTLRPAPSNAFMTRATSSG